MKACYKSHNGKPSVLAVAIEQKYGPEVTDRVMEFLYTDNFKALHGDFRITEPKMPVDESGKEPTIDWVERNVLKKMQLKPGVYTTTDQFNAINKIEKFLEGESSDNPVERMYLMEGGAGVGKTTSINKALENVRGRVGGAAVSDEARGILQQNMPGRKTYTIASLLGLVADFSGPVVDFRRRNEKEELAFRAKGKVDPIETMNVVVVDEASMIDSKTWTMLQELLPAKAKIIFLGDRTQLPPIKEPLSKVFEQLSETERFSKLSEPMRYAKGAPIFELTEGVLANAINENENTDTPIQRNLITEFEDKTTDSEALLFRQDTKELLAEIALMYQESTDTKDIVVIADTNATVKRINDRMRENIYGEEAAKFEVGERVRMSAPFVSNGTVIAANNLKGIVKNSVAGENLDIKVDFVTVEFDVIGQDGQYKKVTHTLPVPVDEAEYKAQTKKLATQAKKDRNWRPFYAFKEAFASMNYAYAMTVHKVQGSTYNNVYVDMDEILRPKSPRKALEINQMLRTATSRAKQKLVMMSEVGSKESSRVTFKPKEEFKPQPIQAELDLKPEVKPKADPKEAVKNEDGTWSQFGTDYKFAEDGQSGEYRQGGKDWEKMADKTAKKKFAEFNEVVPKTEEQPPAAPKVTPTPLKVDNKGLLIKENSLNAEESIAIVEAAKDHIMRTSYKQTKGSVSWDYGQRWARISDNASNAIKASLVPGKQLNGKEITQSMIDAWVAGSSAQALGMPLYGYFKLDINGNKIPPIPQEIVDLLAARGIDVSEYEASYNSVYDKEDNGSLVIHQDNTETNTSPIITISLGRPMKFITYELNDSKEFQLADSAITPYRIAMNFITKNIGTKVPYGTITPSNAMSYAAKVDKKLGTTEASDIMKNALKETFADSIKTEHILQNGAVLVFSEENRNVLHEIVFDKDTDAMPMPAGFPTLNINKAFKSLGKSDKVRPTDDYRVVLTLRKVTGEAVTGNVDKAKLADTQSAPTALDGQASTKPKSLFVEENIKDRRTVEDRVSWDEMKEVIRETFVKEAVENPTKNFRVGYENPKKNKYRNTTGYTQRNYAEMLDDIRLEMGENFPTNLEFSDVFLDVMNNNTSRLGKIYDRAIARTSWGMSESEHRAELAKLTIAVVDEHGATISDFDREYGVNMEQTISEHLSSEAFQIYLTDNNVPVLEMLNAVVDRTVELADEAAAKGDEKLAEMWDDVFVSFAFTDGRKSFASDILKRFQELGFDLNDKTQKKILKALEDKITKDEDSEEEIVLEESATDPDEVTPEDSDIAMEDNTVRGAKDWSESAFQVDPYSTATMRMKMWLAVQPEVDRNGEPISNSLGQASIINLKSLTSKIYSTLANQPAGLSLEKAIKLLEVHPNPNVQQTAKRLKEMEGTYEIGAEFVKVFNMQYADFVLLSSKVQENSHLTFPMSSQRTSQVKTTKDTWKENFLMSDMVVENENGEKNMDIAQAKRHLSLVKSMKYVYEKPTEDRTLVDIKRDFDLTLAINLDDYSIAGKSLFDTLRADELGIEKMGEKWPVKREIISTIMTDIFNEYGVDVNPQGMQYLTRSFKVKGKVQDTATKLTQYTKFAGNFKSQFEFTQNGDPKGLFSIFFAKASGTTNINDDVDYSEAQDFVMKNNPLYTENSAMNVLAKVNNHFEDSVYSDMFKSIEGKSIQSYVQPSALSETIQEMLADFKEFKDEHAATELMSDNGDSITSNWHLNNIDEKTFKLKYLEGIKFQHKKKGVTRTRMSSREHTLTALNMYLNKGNVAKGHFLSLTHSDKTYTPVYYNVPKMKVGFTWGPKPKTLTDEYFNIFLGEYRRAKNVQRLIEEGKEDTLPEAYINGSQKFLLADIMNYSSLSSMDKVLASELYNADGTLDMTADLNAIAPAVKSLMDKHLEYIVEQQYRSFIEANIDATMLDDSWLKVVFEHYKKQPGNEQLDIYKLRKQSKNEQISKDVRAEAQAELDKINEVFLRQAARNFGINNFFWNINSATAFMGDPAYTWKNGKDVAAAQADYSKRLAKDLAPGLKPTWHPSAGKTYARISLKDSYAVDQVIKTSGGNFTKSNGSDAQEIVTMEEYLNNMLAEGLIREDVYNELKAQIKPGKYYEFTEQQEAMLFKPLGPAKPVHTGFGKAENGHKPYHYVKMSRYPLYPKFTADTNIDELRKLMEKPPKAVNNGNPIQVASFESAVKMGGKKPIQLLTEDSFVATNINDVTANVTHLDRKHLRIQQDIPYKESKEAIRLISQMHKLITSGLDPMNTAMTFDYKNAEGENMNIKELKAEKTRLRLQMAEDNLNSLKERMMKGGQWNKPALINALREEAISRGYNQNEISLLETYLDKNSKDFELYLHPSSDKFESVLMSLVKSIVMVDVPGKSYVQASSTGFVRDKMRTEDQVEGSVVYVNGFDPTKRLQPMRIEDGVVKPAQVFAPFNFFVQDETGATVKADINDYLLQEGDEGYVAGKKLLNDKKLPPELLQLVGARIPNQGHSSMLAIEIVGFVPSSMGDLLVVPSAVTGQMGSDFDVDKLFTYKRTYKQGPEGFEKEEGLFQDYFQLHWAVLTHNDMYKNVMNALDKDDMADLADKYQNQGDEQFTSYWTGQTQRTLFESGKDAKALVGLTSLSVTFNERLEDTKLILGHYEKEDDGDGGSTMVKKPDTFKIGGLSLTAFGGYAVSDKGYTKVDNHIIYQSAAVDNAKNRHLDNLNITLQTYPAIQALHQLQDKDGNTLSVQFVIAMMVQEGLVEYTKRMRQNADSLSTSYDANLSDSVLDELISEFETKYSKRTGEEIDMEEVAAEVSKLSIKSLDSSWKGYTNGLSESDNNYEKTQLAVLLAFRDALQYGNRIAELQKTLNQDTNGAGPNFLYARQQFENYNKLGDETRAKIFLNEDSLVDGTEAGQLFESVIGTAKEMGEIFYPVKEITTAVQALAEGTNRTYAEISLDTQRSVLRAFKTAVISSVNMLSSDPQADRFQMLYDSESPSLAKRLKTFKETDKDNYFLNSLQTKIDINSKGPHYITYQANNSVTLNDAYVQKAFVKMLYSENEVERTLAEDLIRYSLLVSGQSGGNSFMSQLPTVFLTGSKFLNGIANLEVNTKAILDQFIQHNPSQAYSIDAEMFEDNLPQHKAVDTYPEILRVDKAKYPEIVNGDNLLPYVSYYDKTEQKTVLYKLQQDDGIKATYMRIDTLGKGFTVEYDMDNDGVVRSIHSANRAAFEFKSETDENALNQEVRRMIEKANSVSNHLANWGMVQNQGTEAQLARVLDNVEADETLPQYFRTLAGFVKPSSKVDSLLRTMTKFGLVEKGLTYGVDENLEAEGDYNPMKRHLRLANRGNKNEAAETLLHELSHHQFSGLAMALGWVNDTQIREQLGENYDAFKKEFDATVAENQKNYPQLFEKLKRLDALRLQALESLPVDASQDLRYALSDIHEFAVHVRTNKETMNYLNEIEAKDGRTLLQSIWDAISDLLNSIADFLGKPVNRKSILAEAYSIVHNVVEVNPVNRAENVIDGILTEHEAKVTSHMLDSIEGIANKIVDTGTQFNIELLHNAQAKSKKTTGSTGMNFVARKMKKQLNALQAVIASRPKTDEDKARVRRAKEQFRETKEDLAVLETSLEIEDFKNIATKQLGWVKSIINKKTPHLQELFLAHELLNLWVNVNDVYKTTKIQDEELKTLINELTGDAVQLYKDVSEAIDTGLIELGRQEGVTLTPDDIRANLKDMSAMENETTSMSRDVNKLIQLMNKVTQRAGQNVVEERRRLRNELNEVTKLFEEYKKESGMDLDDIYKMFLQESADNVLSFGLIQPLGMKWYGTVSNSYKMLRTELDKVNSKLIFNGENKTQVLTKYRKEVYKKFWNRMKDASIVGVNFLFDEDTGKRIEKGHPKFAQAEAEYNRLLQYSGSKQLVDQAIAETAKIIEDYVLRREDKRQEIIEAMEAKNDSEVLRQIGYWEDTLSPFKFSRTSNPKASDRDFKNLGYNAPRFVPRKGTMEDSKYEKMRNDKTADGALSKIYDKLYDMSRKFRDYYPPSRTEYLHDNYLPVVNHSDVASTFSLLKSMSGSSLRRKMISAVSVSSAEMERTEGENKIPIRHINNKAPRNEDGTVDFDNLSIDLPRIFEMFGNSAIHFKNMQPVEHVVRLIEETVKEESKRRMTDTGDKNALTKLIKKIDYFKDYHFYDQARKLELVSSTPKYSLLPWKHDKLKNELDDLHIEKDELEQKLKNDPTASPLDLKNPINVRIAEIEERIREIQKDQYHIVGSKITDKIIKFNQFKSMAFNPFSAFTNVAFGWLSAAAYANGFRADDKETGTTEGDYTIKQFRWAMAEMKHNIASSLGSITGYRGGPKAQKIRNIVEKVGLIDILIDTTYGTQSNLSPSDRSALRRTIDPFAAQYSGDFLIKGAVVLAMIKNTMVTTADGEKISLYDALDEDGNWDAEQFGENKSWSSEDVDEEAEWSALRNKIKKVGLIIFGNQDSAYEQALRGKWWGRLIGQFRLSWVPEGVNSRWGRQYEDADLGRTVEGRYRTLTRMGSRGIGLLMKQIASTVTGADPFEGVKTMQMVEQADGSFKETPAAIQGFEKENMRRNLAGLTYTAIMSAIVFALTAMVTDEDDEQKKKQLYLALNMAIRTQQDLLFYSNPFTAEQLLGQVVPSMSVINDFWNAAAAIPGLWDEKDRKRATSWKKIFRAFPLTNNYPKLKYHTERNLAEGKR